MRPRPSLADALLPCSQQKTRRKIPIGGNMLPKIRGQFGERYQDTIEGLVLSDANRAPVGVRGSPRAGEL